MGRGAWSRETGDRGPEKGRDQGSVISDQLAVAATLPPENSGSTTATPQSFNPSFLH